MISVVAPHPTPPINNIGTMTAMLALIVSSRLKRLAHSGCSYDAESYDQADQAEDRGDAAANEPGNAFPLARLFRRRAGCHRGHNGPEAGKRNQQPVQSAEKRDKPHQHADQRENSPRQAHDLHGAPAASGSRSFFLRDLSALLSGFRQTDGNRLFAAFHGLPALAAL